MTGRVFTKLLVSFVLVLLVGTAILDFSLRPIFEHAMRDQTHATRDLVFGSVLALAAATLLAAFFARRVAERYDRIVLFANRIAAGDLSARLEEDSLGELSEVAHALDATASRLDPQAALTRQTNLTRQTKPAHYGGSAGFGDLDVRHAWPALCGDAE